MKTVCVQGLGFVGAAMATAVANAKDSQGKPLYRVIGVDLANKSGQQRIDSINSGRFPFETTDVLLTKTISNVVEEGILSATSDESVYENADIILVDVHLDIDWEARPASIKFNGFKQAIRTIGMLARPGTLVILETTVPPGTTSKVVVPKLNEELEKRGLPEGSLLVAHSYERVMPGAEYFNSIVNYWRVYSGINEESADACEKFLSTVINVIDYPLTRLHNTNASELSKVLENTYRAATIALMDEWATFAEKIGVDIFDVVSAIRMRPTHSNIRTPGFGVGGYCLTKDPLFGKLAARELHGLDLEFPFSSAAVDKNKEAPHTVLKRLGELIGGIKDKRILLLGISYRQDVADTRYSPSEEFFKIAQALGAEVLAYDPMVDYWEELSMNTLEELPSPDDIDAVIVAVPHNEFSDMDFSKWAGDVRPVIYDAFGLYDAEKRRAIRDEGFTIESLGRGAGL